MTDTTAQHIAARNDKDLKARLVASAEQAAVPDAELWVTQNIGRLISTKVEGDSTITTVHAYADDVRKQAVAALPPAPGLNPGAVTDTHLAAAVQAVWNPTEEAAS